MKSNIKAITLLLITVFCTACVSTAIGVVGGAAVGVTKVAVTAPIKVGGAVIDASSDDDED